MKLLHVDSSVLGANSVSRQLTAEVGRRMAQHPPRHRRSTTSTWRWTPPATSTPIRSASSVGLQAEPTEAPAPRERRLRTAGEPVPGRRRGRDRRAALQLLGARRQLKAWIDRIAQAGRTFKYTDKGPVGLAGGKTVIVASTPRRRLLDQRRRPGDGAPGKLPEGGVRLLRHHRRALRARRRPGDGRRAEGSRTGRRPRRHRAATGKAANQDQAKLAA